MNLTEEELLKLKEVQNTDLWDKAVKEILQKRDGFYPPDWYEKVIKSPDIDTSLSIKTFDTWDDLLNYLNA